MQNQGECQRQICIRFGARIGGRDIFTNGTHGLGKREKSCLDKVL